MGTLRDSILGAADLPTEEVQTPEWGPFGVPSVVVRGLSAHDRDQYEQSLTVSTPDGGRRAKPNFENLRAGFVAMVVVDPETGDLAFGTNDVKKLGEKNAEVIDRLWTAGRKLSGMATVEEEGNPSEAEAPDTSSSASPSPTESQTQDISPID